MTTKKAVIVLEKQIQSLNNLSDENWLLQTKSFIKDFLGEDSEEYKSSKKLEFPNPYRSMFDEENKKYRNESEAEIKAFIYSTIETLKIKGVKQEPFFKTISETAFWTIVSILTTAVFGLGVFIGNLQSDKQNIELRLELIKKEDSLVIFRTATQKNTQPKSTGQTNPK